MSTLKIGFMGTPEFALASLKALHESHHDVTCVYTQPPRPKGRGHQVQKSPVHEYAEKHGIAVFTPDNLKSAKAQAEFAAHNLDVAVVAAYGLILPKPVLEAPKYGCINIHASLLPRWRGASPIQQAIWKGDKETGVSIMQMEEGLDTGPVLSQQAIPISKETTAPSLHNELQEIGATLILDVINLLAAGDMPKAELQDDEKTTYAPLLTKEDGRIEWDQTSEEIDRQIRALNPWPGVWSEFDDCRIKILEAQLTDQETDQKSGTILGREGDIACGDGTVLKILKLHPAGAAKTMDFTAAVNGGYLKL